MTIAPHILAFFLMVVVPVWGYFHTRQLKRTTDPTKRLRAYRLAIGWQWTATVVACALVGPRQLVTVHLPASEAGWVPAGGFIGGLLISVIVGILASTLLAARRPRVRDFYSRQLETLRFLLPITA